MLPESCSLVPAIAVKDRTAVTIFNMLSVAWGKVAKQCATCSKRLQDCVTCLTSIYHVLNQVLAKDKALQSGAQ